ncbi:MAG: sialidase family protein, partial [Nitrososphaerales archaeon]
IPEVNDEGRVNFYGNAEVIMTRSLDGGRTFEKPVNLSNNPTGSYAPTLAVQGDNVYIVWMESDFPSNEAKVSLRISDDGGKTFGGIAENLVGLISEPVSRPRVLTSPDGEQIYILWSELTDESTVNMYALTSLPLE